MTGATQTSTEERLDPLVEKTIAKIIKESENLEQVGSPEPSGTSSELQPFTLMPRIDLAYNHYLQIITSQVHQLYDEQYEQLLRKIISNYKANYKELLDSISRIFQQEIWGETLSSYLTLDLGLGVLEQPYRLRRRTEVTEFLTDNSFLLPVLGEAYEQIRNHFGKSTQITLEVVTDPEVAGDQELAIFIRTNLSPDKAFEKLEQLGEEWWLDTPFNVREKLCIDVEFE